MSDRLCACGHDRSSHDRNGVCGYYDHRHACDPRCDLPATNPDPQAIYPIISLSPEDAGSFSAALLSRIDRLCAALEEQNRRNGPKPGDWVKEVGDHVPDFPDDQYVCASNDGTVIVLMQRNTREELRMSMRDLHRLRWRAPDPSLPG